MGNLIKRKKPILLAGPEAEVVDIACVVEVRVGEILLVVGAFVMLVCRQCVRIRA